MLRISAALRSNVSVARLCSVGVRVALRGRLECARGAIIRPAKSMSYAVQPEPLPSLVRSTAPRVKQLFMNTPWVETERFTDGLARLDADPMAARTLLEAQVTCVWRNPER